MSAAFDLVAVLDGLIVPLEPAVRAAKHSLALAHDFVAMSPDRKAARIAVAEDRLAHAQERLKDALAARDELKRLIAVALEANELCRSAHAVAERIATQYSTIYAGTDFGALHGSLNASLPRQHAALSQYQKRALDERLAGGASA